MPVYKSPKSPYWQYDFLYQGKRYYGSTGAKTEAAARRVEQAKRVSAALGKEHRRTVPTLDQAAAEWFVAHGQTLKSADDLEYRLALAVELLGKNKPVNEVTAADIAEAIAKRRGRLVPGGKVPKNGTVNRDIISTIRPVLRRQRLLLNSGVGEPVPFPEIKWGELKLKEPKAKPKEFSGVEIDGLVSALPAWWRDFARFQGRYGLRLGEMFFALSDVDVKGRRLTIGTVDERKNGNAHIIPLLDDDAAMLAARIGRARAAKLDTVWFRELKGGRLKALAYWGAQKALGKVMHALEGKGARGSHDLRHHAGMQMLRATGNLRVTQKLLGHSSIQSTLVYAHALDKDLREGLEAVSRNSHEPVSAEAEKPKENKAVGD